MCQALCQAQHPPWVLQRLSYMQNHHHHTMQNAAGAMWKNVVGLGEGGKVGTIISSRGEALKEAASFGLELFGE